MREAGEERGRGPRRSRCVRHRYQLPARNAIVMHGRHRLVKMKRRKGSVDPRRSAGSM